MYNLLLFFSDFWNEMTFRANLIQSPIAKLEWRMIFLVMLPWNWNLLRWIILQNKSTSNEELLCIMVFKTK